MINEIIVKILMDTGSIERRFYGRWDETNHDHIKDIGEDVRDFLLNLYLDSDQEEG